MIDLQKAKEAFDEYVSNYDIQNGMIKLKIDHTKRVAQISKKIAENLKLSDEDIQLAELIGLLHDIGRFEQAKIYGTFNDAKSINHGEKAIKVLFEENWIRKFIDDDRYDSIIYNAVLNHNRANIDTNLTEKEILHSKIIRDADKTDILYVVMTEPILYVYHSNKIEIEEITDEIFREFLEDKKIDYKQRRTHVDTLICHFAFAFDLNFEYTLRYIYNQKYMDKIAEKIKFKNEETQKRVYLARDITNKYIEEKIGVRNV